MIYECKIIRLILQVCVQIHLLKPETWALKNYFNKSIREYYNYPYFRDEKIEIKRA